MEQQAIRDASTQRLGARLRRARLTRNLTQGEVAKNQFSVSYVSAVERGQIRPSLGALEKLAERLQVPITDLLGDTDFEAKFGATPTAAETRDPAAERVREDVDAKLRDAQALALQDTPQSVQQAVEILQRLSATTSLNTREQAALAMQLSPCYVQQRRGEDARRVAQDGLAAAERAHDDARVARLRFALGKAHALLHANALALDAFRRCVEAIEAGKVTDPAFHLDALAQLGNQYTLAGDHDQAMRTRLQAAKVAESVTNPAALGKTYWSLSRSFSDKGDAAMARYYTLKSINAYQEAESRQAIAGIHNRLGRAYAEVGSFDDAREQLRTAQALASAQRDVSGVAEAQRGLAVLALKQGNLDEAAAAAQDALERTKGLPDARERAETLLVWAQVQERQRQLDEAQRTFEEAITLLREGDAPERLREAYAQFSEFLERKGDSRRALEMLRQAFQTAARHNLAQ
jgi:tetratricopeptide (TPR) repeat protein